MIQKSIVHDERIEKSILLIRGQKVMLDADLAEIYGVSTSRLNEQVRRNKSRFPEDFMFQLTREEFNNLISHFATSSSGWGGRRKLPLVFTEHGAIMAASVLSTPRAIQMSVYVVRAFVRLRAIISTHKELAAKVLELERKLSTHDRQIASIINVIKQLMSPAQAPKRLVGFRPEKKNITR